MFLLRLVSRVSRRLVLDTVAIAKAAEERSVGTALRNVAVDTATEVEEALRRCREGNREDRESAT